MSALLEVTGLHKRFGDRVVLEDITLAVAEGTLHGIIGPNGAGKTTCFNVLTGRFRPDRGQVRFAGRDVTGLAADRLVRLGIARSFQAMTVFDDFTALDNVRIALPEVRRRAFDPLRSMTGDRAAHDRAAAVLGEVGLAGRESTPAKQLSYGDRRALEIAIALAAEPRILFLDEPTAGLGHDGTARLVDLVRRLKRRLTLVVIEHDLQFLFSLADTVSVIHWGQVIAQGTPAELRADPWAAKSTMMAGGAP